eukprot:663016-Alexandrium_andersonii.AAC.1
MCIRDRTPMWGRSLSRLRAGAKQGAVEIDDDGPNAEEYKAEEPYQESESWGKDPAVAATPAAA